VRIAPQHTEAIDPLLRDAYAAYRNGNLDEARQSYLSMLAKDSRSADALLGLAAIAQQRGENLMAAQYFARVLTLDPRNAVANAGMSALNTEDEGNESRLKMLLREQDDSAALHFALGNLYAGQSRWGEAQQAYFNAWTLDADNAEFAYNLAVSLDHLGQAELATRYYRRAQQLDATHSAGFDHTQVARRIEALGQQGR
jgi:tetratricopeptide (TPR) repeat protein